MATDRSGLLSRLAAAERPSGFLQLRCPWTAGRRPGGFRSPFGDVGRGFPRSPFSFLGKERMPRPASNSSFDSTASLYSWAPSPARDFCYSRPRTPSSPPPLQEEVPGWQGHLTRPYPPGFQQPHPRSSSDHPMGFQRYQKPKQRGRTPPQSQPLTQRIPRVHSTFRSSPIHVPPLGDRMYFLEYKEQELLEWHIQKKHALKKAPPVHWQKEAPSFSLLPSSKTKLQVGIISEKEEMHCVSLQLPPDQRSRSHRPPSASPKGPQTPPKPPPAQVKSPGPCTHPPVHPPRDFLPPPLVICRTSSHSSIKALTDGNPNLTTPQEGLTELLSLLGQSKSLSRKQAGRPKSPREKEKQDKNLLN